MLGELYRKFWLQIRFLTTHQVEANGRKTRAGRLPEDVDGHAHGDDEPDDLDNEGPDVVRKVVLDAPATGRPWISTEAGEGGGMGIQAWNPSAVCEAAASDSNEQLQPELVRRQAALLTP